MTAAVDIAPIGGSEAAAACGLSPYVSPVELYLEKRGEWIRERPPHVIEAADWGHRLQPLVAQAVEERGYVVVPAPADAVLDPDRPWMSGHPDGYVGDRLAIDWKGPTDGPLFLPSHDGRGVLELKTASPFVRGWDRPEGPMHYELQVRHYLALTDLEWGLLACLVGGQRLELKRIERDERIEAMLVELEREFYERCVAGEPPPPDGSASAGEILRKMYPTATEGKVAQFTAEALMARNEYRRLREQIGLLEKEKERQGQLIRHALGDCETGVYEGEVVATWRNVSVKESVRPARTDRRLHVP